MRRYAAEELGYRVCRRRCGSTTAHGARSFGRLGMIYDLIEARQRLLRALVFTAVFSRHIDVYCVATPNFETPETKPTYWRGTY